MKKEELEKYIGELSPELQEKARQCKTMDELNALLAENDVELSEDALQAVSGGCKSTVNYYYVCRLCGQKVAACTEADRPAIEEYLRWNSKDYDSKYLPNWFKCRAHGIRYIRDNCEKIEC
jgi:hypothetical protein